jgi:hypothetical protein
MSEVAQGLTTTDPQIQIPCPRSDKAQPLDKMTPDCLTLIRKPLLIEKHKGGRIWGGNSLGDRCLQQWITNTTGYTDICLDNSNSID